MKAAAKDLDYGTSKVMCPFMIRNGGTLYAFNKLRDEKGPFHKVVVSRRARCVPLEEWLADGVNKPRLTTLLNRALNKLTGRKGLRLDKEHHRYFFQSDEPGKILTVKYRPLNLPRLVERNVVWRPINKRTGQASPIGSTSPLAYGSSVPGRTSGVSA